MYRKFIKRLLDILISVLGLLILSVPLLIIALLVRCKLGSPVIFTQLRPGKDERIFKMYKFRSMTNAKDEFGNLLPDNQRLPKFGKLLRSTSLDELPELFNILKGDMSIVGPRPLSIFYLPDFTKESRRRHEVRPGLTGYAQVNGRNNLAWHDRFRLDTDYIDNMSLWLDLKILVQTALKVIRRSDVTLRGRSDYTLSRILEEEGNTHMQTKEIGSSFAMETPNIPTGINPDTLNLPWLPDGDKTFTLSGRASIGLALSDLCKNREVHTAYVPSYCCLSMLQPFLDRRIDIVFYNVSEKNGNICYEIDTNKKCDVFLAMSYFGLSNPVSDDIIKTFKDNGTVVIEDITHRFMSKSPCSPLADYYAISLRKWFATPAGGCLIKSNGVLSIKADEESSDVMKEKVEAMCDKRDYLAGADIDKEKFLEKFYKGDRVLSKVNENIKMDGVSAEIIAGTDINEVREKRIANAKVIYSRLSALSVKPLVASPDWENDCPLFVPVLVPEKDRDSLRRHLIDNGIYCPVHWPEVMGAEAGLRSRELSLICDQRYSIEDMERMMNCVAEYYANADKKTVLAS